MCIPIYLVFYSIHMYIAVFFVNTLELCAQDFG